MLQVQLIGILGLVAIAACWGLAVVLYRVGTVGSAARKLAVLLVVEGFVLATAGFPEFVFDVPDSYFESHQMLGFFLGLVHHLGRDSLGITESDAEAIESELQTGLAAPA